MCDVTLSDTITRKLHRLFNLSYPNNHVLYYHVSMHTLEQFTMHAREAVRKAEKVIMPYFRTDEKTLQTETKIDDDRFSHEYQKSVVTIADQKAEQTIKAYLHKQFPTHGFI